MVCSNLKCFNLYLHDTYCLRLSVTLSTYFSCVTVSLFSCLSFMISLVIPKQATPLFTTLPWPCLPGIYPVYILVSVVYRLGPLHSFVVLRKPQWIIRLLDLTRLSSSSFCISRQSLFAEQCRMLELTITRVWKSTCPIRMSELCHIPKPKMKWYKHTVIGGLNVSHM